MLIVGNSSSKYYPYEAPVSSLPTTDTEDYGTVTGYDEDSGEEDEELNASEEIILPEEEQEEMDETEAERYSLLYPDDNEILKRQMAYPPLPDYQPPGLRNEVGKKSGKKGKSASKSSHPRERLGVFTPVEELTEPPSSAGTLTEESSSLTEKKRRPRHVPPKQESRTREKINENNEAVSSALESSKTGNDINDYKSILKSTSSSPLPSVPSSPDRKVQFSPEKASKNPDAMRDQRRTSVVSLEKADGNGPYSGHPTTPESASNVEQSMEPENNEEGNTQKEAAEDKLEKVITWQLDNDAEGEEETSHLDAEFPSILDDMIADLHGWDRMAGANASAAEIYASRQDHLANISTQLASYLSHISVPTLISNLPQLIPLITTLLFATESNFRAQLSSLNAVTIFSQRLKDSKLQTGLKVLPNADLTWLVRTLCHISSEDSSRSVLKSVGTSALASLVKAAGPEMIFEPIHLILTGTDEKVPLRPEGSGKIVAMGPGGAPKVKATALDTLTFALLTFPRDNFDLQLVAKLACHCLFHPKRRVRQAALECLAVVAQSLGPTAAVPMLKKFIAAEEEKKAFEEAMSKPPEPRVPTPPPPKVVDLQSHYDQELEIDPPKVIAQPSKIPVPIRSPKKTLSYPPPSPKKNSPNPVHSSTNSSKGPTASAAVSARISRHILPSPNLEELVEYGVKIPASCPLVSRQSRKVEDDENAQELEVDEGEGGNSSRIPSSSAESSSSVSNIDYSLIELEPILNPARSGGHKRGISDPGLIVMGADIEWILLGIGPVKRCDSSSSGILQFQQLLPQELLSPFHNQHQHQPLSPVKNSSRGGKSSIFLESASESSSDDMRRISLRNELIQDSFVQDPVVGRYYYPPPSHFLTSPRTGDPSLSRYSSKASYNLLPNKYSVLARNGSTGSSTRSDLIASHPNNNAMLPGAYGDGPFLLDVQSELGSLKKTPLEPVEYLREKFFESQSQSSSQDHGDEYEPAEVFQNPNPKTETKPNRSSKGKPPLPHPRQLNDEISVKRQTEMVMQGVPRDYQVYHSRVEFGANNSKEERHGNGIGNGSELKRGDADSAGSNHTRDSGVSTGGSKTPPSVQNSPPTRHKVLHSGGPEKPPASSSSSKPEVNLSRNWRSTPDVPLQLGEEASSSGRISRNRHTPVRSGPPRREDSSSSSSDRSRNQKFAHISSSEETMPVHRRPVLARRGQSVTRVGATDPRPPPLKHSSYSSRDSLHDDGSGDHSRRDHDTNTIYTLSPSEIRNSVSTGNLHHPSDNSRVKIPSSKSTYFTEDNGNEYEGSPPRTGRRVSSRKDGPFGDVRASFDPSDNIKPAVKAPKGRIVPTKVYKGSIRDINSNRNQPTEVFPSDMKPVTSPKHALPLALGQLDSTDWETNVAGFRQLVRIIRFDPDIVRGDLHNISMTGIKHLINLRSQVCRAAILCFKELFCQFGRAMESDCEKISEKLLDKCADTNKFIREDSGKALEAMIANLTPVKGMTCLDLFGTRHRNPVVRCTTSRLTLRLVETIGPDRCLSELPERMLPMLCKFLQEGSLETRTSAKSAMSTLMHHPNFFTLLRKHVPSDVLRHAQKNIDALQK